MSTAKEPMKKPKNILPIEIRKELALLPNIIKEKKSEKEIMYKEVLISKEKINSIKKELDKLSVNISNFEKEYISFMLKNDKIKSEQKIVLNLINNETINNNILFQNNKNNELKEIFFFIFNIEKNYEEEISNTLCNNNIEITKLLIGVYTYLKMLQNDIPVKYKQIKSKILDIINKLKIIKEDNIYKLIISYIENIFIILDNKEKNNFYKTKHEALIKEKNKIFIKLKLAEEQKKSKEEKLNLISCFIKDLSILFEKNKILLNFPKNKPDKIIDKNKIINVSQNSLNISCPKNTINNELVKNEEKISIINIDLTNTSLLEKKYYNKINKRTIESFELNKINNNKKRNGINKYQNIYELEKDINEHFIEVKNNPLFKMRKKLVKKKVNNNTNKENKLSINKSKEKRIKKISKNNTTMTYNNNTNANASKIISSINNIINNKELNKSFDSTSNKKTEKENKDNKNKLENNTKRIIQLKYQPKEEKKNNIEEEKEEKEKINISLNEIDEEKINKKINIKHNKTILKKKQSLNKITINLSKNDFERRISYNNYSFRKNSPDVMKTGFLSSINKINKDKYKEIIMEQNELRNKVKNLNSNNSLIINNTSNNCHIIPFKKYKINYIKDKKNVIVNKINKNGIKGNNNNYNADKIKGNYIGKKV